ncbi:MAG TPA: ABC transporter substrate-binding protein [Trueperaceae bacterium]
MSNPRQAAAQRRGRSLRRAPAAALLLATLGAAFAQGTITVALPTDVRDFDPHQSIATHERAIQQNIFDTLIDLDRDYEPTVPALATSWTYVDDVTLEVKLREGVTFHNGEPFDADDVVFTFDRVLDSTEPIGINSWVAGTLDRVEKVDDHTVRFVTPEPYAPLIANLTRVHIIPDQTFQEMGAEEFAQHPVGTGAFRFVSWTPGEEVVLEKYEDHWREGMPYIDRAVFRIIPDEFARFAALSAGEVDIVQNLPASRIEQVEADPNLRVESVWGQRNMWIGIMIVPPLDDVRIRQALNYAVDKQAIIDSIFDGQAGAVAPGGFGALAFGYHDDVEAYPYDPQRARELLAEAGYPNGLDLEFRCSSDRYASDREVCQAIQAYLAAVGVNTEVQFTEWAVYSQLRADRSMQGLYFLGYGNSLFDADFPLRLCCWSGGRAETRFSTPELDAMIEEAARTVDTQARYDLYGQIQRYIRDQAPYIFLYDQFDIYGISNRVEWEPWATELIPLVEARIAD